MLTLTLTFTPLSPFSPLFTPRLTNFSTNRNINLFKTKKKLKKGTCRAELSGDAPFAVAIGACMVSSLLLPNDPGPDEEEEEEEAVAGTGYSGLDSTDTRLAAMGIISFIPYFNWLSWVFAWLDTGKRRYAVYAFVYLAPYLRSNLSLSPEESWLPLTSIVLGVIHVQLEASIRNGDIQGFQLFSEASKHFSLGERDANLERHRERPKGRKRDHKNLPSAEEQSRKEIQQWDVRRKAPEHRETSNGDWYEDNGDESRH